MKLGLGLGNDLHGQSRGGVFGGLLLDKYSGAAAAYSLRSLSSNTTNVVRVRRSSDNAEQDFTATEVTDGTLETWVGANDGFVTTWYDQSGNSNDATQATAASQPKIVDSGSLVTENGKAAVDFDGVDDFIGYAETTLTNTFSAFFIGKTNSGTAEQNFYDYGIEGSGGTSTRTVHSAGVGNLGLSPTNTISVRSLLQLNDYTIGTTSTTNQILLSHFSDGTSIDGYLDSIQMTDSRTNRGFNTDFVAIGSRGDGTFNLNGVVHEVIFYTTDQSANRTAIESNINSYYNIY